MFTCGTARCLPDKLCVPLPNCYLKGIETGCPCIGEIRGTQCAAHAGRYSQGTAIRAPDFHNARATILNPLYIHICIYMYIYIMGYKIIKKTTKLDVNWGGQSMRKSHFQSRVIKLFFFNDIHLTYFVATYSKEITICSVDICRVPPNL